MDFDWKDLVRTVAPTVATALGSPVAGIAVKALADSLLGDDTATEEQVAQAIKNASPDDLLKLKTIEQDFILTMKKLDIDLKITEQTNLTERHKNDMTSDSWLSKNVRPVALIYLMALFTMAFFLDVPETVLEMLRDLLMTVFAFYFGLRTFEKAAGMYMGKQK